MAFRRRRRRPRVAWFPVFGNGIAAEGSNPAMGYWEQSQIQIPDDGSFSLDYFPLTFDEDTDEQTASGLAISAGTLRDIVEGQEWRLRRIVGTLYLGPGRFPGQEQGLPKSYFVDVAAGFIVARTNPVGGGITTTANPMLQAHAEYPWIWRRRWILRDATWGQAGLTQGTQFWDLSAAGGIPVSNINLPHHTGPYIDQKTARVIKHNERLILIIATRTLVKEPTGTVSSYLGVHFDYRLLGSMKGTVVGNRHNTSR